MQKILLYAFLLAATPLGALAADGKMAVQPDAVKWGPAPPGFPPGAQVAVISGDPSKAGPYVVRAKMPAGYKIMPHTHPTDENVTVLSGTAHIAMGDKFDTKKGETVPAGGFFSAKQGMQHYFWVTSAAVIQVHGVGPFEINYVNATDDPRNKTGCEEITLSRGSLPRFSGALFCL
jgi:quercetin dioxygenase-like cupin family protein